MASAPLPRPPVLRWSAEEEQRLLEAWDKAAAVKDLALNHGRSIGAIESRLLQLGAVSYAPYDELLQQETADKESPLAMMGKPWQEADIAALLTAHALATTGAAGVPELERAAEALGRTPRALVLKLVALGALQPTRVHPLQRRATKVAPPAPVKKTPTAKPEGKKQTITVTAEFQTALTALHEGENILVLGKAGTGKSTFLKWARQQLESKKPVVLAPTGMAALQVGGQTIHSFFGFKPKLMTGHPDDWHKPRNPKLFAQLQLLIIDEVSMVRADVFQAIHAFLTRYGPHKGQPFGGVQLLLVGDICQLPPVVTTSERSLFEERYATPFFFSAEAYAYGHFGAMSFSHIFRQKDALFIEILNAVRHGQLSPSQMATLNARASVPEPKDAVLLAARNRTVETINSAELERLSGMPQTYAAVTKGKMEGTSLTTPHELILKPGARVLFTRNDTQGRWVNGSLGTIMRCGSGWVEVRLTNGPQSGEVHRVEPVTWESLKYSLGEDELPMAEVSGSFTQLPLTHAWALTIHKAQGQTLASCIIDLSDGGTFTEGQLYVALSRATHLEGLFLRHPIERKHLKVHPAVMDFLGSLESPLSPPAK